MSSKSLRRDVLKVAIGQMTSGTRYEDNIRVMRAYAREAANAGCDLLAMPEVAGLMDRNRTVANADLPPPERDPFVLACREAACEHAIWINTGSSPVSGGGGLLLNRSSLIDATGTVIATYDKIHLFDVELRGQPPIRESSRYAPGHEAVVVATPWGKWGLTICYDLRFPSLFSDYGERGVNIIFVPSAFTVKTGAMHWQVLLRARAIENGSFIVAAAQVGQHEDGRRTWGHSLVVDPWGEVVLDMGREAAGLAIIELDLSAVEEARNQIPSLQNRRPYRVIEVPCRN